MIIDLHAVIGNRWSRIAAQLPGRTDNEIKNYWNTRIKKRLRQMGIDPNTHQPLTISSHASSSSSNLDDSETASSDVTAPSTTLAHACKNSVIKKEEPNFELAGEFNDQDAKFPSSGLNLLSTAPTTKELLDQTSSGKTDLAVFELMQSKATVASKNLVGPRSPTSVISHGMDEDCEDASSAMKNGGGSVGLVMANETESKNWMMNSSLQQQSWDSSMPMQAETVPRMSTVVGLSSVDPNIADYLQWIDMPVAWGSSDQENISQPYYELGTHAGGDLGANSNVPWLQLSDGYTFWADSDMTSAACQELQRLAAILDDL
ncbi:hypothetical protein O6H91_01G115000 [Diphasiastrum complanatum]|nr:hypothetical protein O6H91_01G115000 [Diphasiastrum complanatum]